MEPFEGGPGEADETKSVVQDDSRAQRGFQQSVGAIVVLGILAFLGMGFLTVLIGFGIWEEKGLQKFTSWAAIVSPFLIINGIALWRTYRMKQTTLANQMSSGGLVLILFGLCGLSFLALLVSTVCCMSINPITRWH